MTIPEPDDNEKKVDIPSIRVYFSEVGENQKLTYSCPEAPQEVMRCGLSVWVPHLTFCSSTGGFRRFGTRHMYGILFVAKGSGFLTSGDKTWSLKRGDLFTVWPDRPFLYQDLPEAPWDLYWFQLGGPGRESLLRRFGLSPDRPVQRCARPDAVIQHFEAVRQYWESKRGDAWRSASLLFDLFASFQTDPVRSVPRRSTAEMVEAALALIDSLLETGIGVADLARILRVRPDTLARVFREHRDQSPGACLQEARLRRAQDMLESTEEKISTIAQECGFRYEKYFYRFFKEKTGLTPGQWREKAQVEKTQLPSSRANMTEPDGRSKLVDPE
ncbi:AraC family transcriptional regulator [bacterium]|nr:AraC family transcriptional regulator [bacterium]